MDEAGGGDAYAYLNNSGYTFRLAVTSAAGSDQGRVAGPSCAFSAVTGGALLQLEIKAKSGSEKGSLRGEFITLGVGSGAHFVQVCRITLRRTATTLVQPIPSCP